MKKLGYCSFVFILITLLYVLACNSSETKPELNDSTIPSEQTVLAPSDSETPDEDTIERPPDLNLTPDPKVIVPPDLGDPPDPLVLAHAGRLYDKWWVEADIEEPTDNNPLWSLQSFNTRNGSDTWRCKECHGWDYRGQDGAYSSGSHFTGFPGIYGSLSMPPWNAACADISTEHDFRVLGDTHLEHISDFLKWGMIDVTQYIDYGSKKPITADVENGKRLFETTCTDCHGNSGKKINFGSDVRPEYIGSLAADNPWEVLHKIRFGQPGTSMPAGTTIGWSVQDAVDVLDYLQILPIE